MLSPATRTNTPCFSHRAPKYAPIPMKKNEEYVKIRREL